MNSTSSDRDLGMDIDARYCKTMQPILVNLHMGQPSLERMAWQFASDWLVDAFALGVMLCPQICTVRCRWYSCTNGFLELFDAIRGLHMQLNAMGVAKELASVVL